eukprot:1770977-Pyramimonas_sp.AAC.1
MKRLAVAVAPNPTATRRTGVQLFFLFIFECESNPRPLQQIVHEGRQWRERSAGQALNYDVRNSFLS